MAQGSEAIALKNKHKNFLNLWLQSVFSSFNNISYHAEGLNVFKYKDAMVSINQRR